MYPVGGRGNHRSEEVRISYWFRHMILMRAREVMEDTTSGFGELAAVLETDQAIATRVLKMANSSYYGMSGKVSSIKHASVVLGQKTLSELITMVSASSVLGNTLTGYGLDSGDHSSIKQETF